MPSLEKLRTDVIRLRTVAALQRLHAKHGFLGATRADLNALWRDAHFAGGLLHHEAGGDPALLVAIYLEHAMRKYRGLCDTRAPARDFTRMCRDNGVQTVPRLYDALKAYAAAGGQKPPDGWPVPYVNWDRRRPNEPLPVRTVLLGGGLAALARKAEAARVMPASQLENLSYGDAYLVAIAMGIDGARVPLDYPERMRLIAKIIDAQQRLPGLEEPAPAVS